MYDLCLRILKAFELTQKYEVKENSFEPGSSIARRINCEASERILGAYNSTPLIEGLEKTIEWYKKEHRI